MDGGNLHKIQCLVLLGRCWVANTDVSEVVKHVHWVG